MARLPQEYTADHLVLDKFVLILVTSSAKGNEVRLDIITERATPSLVVNIEILVAATYLTAPVVTSQDFLAQLRI